MIFFERIFSAYYFLFLKKRKFNKYFKSFFFRSTDEDFGAFMMMMVGQMLLVGLIIAIAKSTFQFNVSRSTSLPIMVLLVFGAVGYFEHKYFIANRERRRIIFETYRILPRKQKVFWTIMALLILIVPIVMFPIIL